MSYRHFIPIVLFGLMFLIIGCVCPTRDGRTSPSGEKLPLTEKQPQESQSKKPSIDESQAYAPGQVLVKLKAGYGVGVLDNIAYALGLEKIEALPIPDTYLMKIVGSESVENMVKKLEVYDSVEYAEPNFSTQTQ